GGKRAQEGAGKGHGGLPMEGFVASWYARNTGHQMEEFRQHARLVAEHVPEGGSVLEIAPGPGYLAIELARLGRRRVVGLDISETFVRIATEKAKEAGVAVWCRRGHAPPTPAYGQTGR